MKENMQIVALLCLFLCCMQTAGSEKISLISEEKKSIPLNMVEDAVDDMYFGCNETMMKMINKYFEKEKNEPFGEVWNSSESCTNRSLEYQKNETEDKALTKDHMQAICVYTSNHIYDNKSHDEFYKTFNTAVRTNRNIYRTAFKFHFLHFWLTSAVQTLNNEKKCHTSYRRTSSNFTGDVNQTIRFGSFASTSYDTTLTVFGNETCFKIKTCLGAFLKKYSYFEDEEEVLIPPYEKFKIKEKIQDKSVEGLNDCEVVYILESDGIASNLNCQVANQANDKWFFNRWSKVKTK
uniref:ecto-ADP-ribosyltransferase 4-like n=1 Tax=Scatophagus argus TaxID=75038 RepID=UPI001ED7F3E1|nr:ecto-ADP-ribosyltransferase 4-like [Scatophagus argus]